MTTGRLEDAMAYTSAAGAPVRPSNRENNKAAANASWIGLLKATIADWVEDDAQSLGAALAYYSIFSLAPLVIISIGIVGLIFGSEVAQTGLHQQLENVMGSRVAAAVESMSAAARSPSGGAIATIIGVVTLLIGATGVFGQLQNSMNKIWEVERKKSSGILGWLKDRFLSLTLVLGTAFLLLVSLLLSAMLSFIGGWIGNILPAPEIVLQIGNFILSFAVISVLFAMIFKWVPDVHISWRDVWAGAIITAVLFAIGKWALGIYLGKAAVSSNFGAAGSLVLVLVWVYYSSQILFLGAEFTQAFARRRSEQQD
jgi:membrane protein